MARTRAGYSRGMTLLELLVVLMVLSLILTAAVKAWDVTLERGRYETTRKRLEQLATAITGDRDYVVAGRRADFGFVGDIGRLPEGLIELASDPNPGAADSLKGWRGPYLRAPFNESPTAFLFDGWGDSIIYNKDSLFLRSYGGRGLADRTRWMTHLLGYSKDELLLNEVNGRVVDVTNAPPQPDDSASIRVMMRIPAPDGTKFWYEVPVDINGGFVFDNIPQGNHLLAAKHVNYTRIPRDSVTTTVTVTVYPGFGQDVAVQVNRDWDNEH